jgi:RNA polymerase sigma-70 factor (ECF subfamily)
MKSEMYHPFPNTHWSLVRRAGEEDAGVRREALGVLLVRYAPALRSYLRVVKKVPTEQVEDLVQGFIAERMLEGEIIARADPARGRFRALLLTSLNNYAASRWRAERVRRGEMLGEQAEEMPSATSAPAVAVEAAWARTLVRDVLAAMRRECMVTERADVWAVFEGRILAEIFGEGDVVPYEVLATELGLKTPGQAANLLVTGKRMYARLLRQAVGEYEREPAAVEAEIADLQRVLAAGDEGLRERASWDEEVSHG